MKFRIILLLSWVSLVGPVRAQGPTLARAPLRQNPFIELPLGAIRPEGWLREMLVRQKEGATGHLDSLYPEVMGRRNGWASM